ncbi:MAG: Unknown protein [uncultured Thiotrichaceae bacterium]|uniref:Uncharacterized protein n=1 Tax=uncultured Thiotrichaceae bacterium TaxID=298394 RepID=A0A6S6TNH9_9GAMM|nr:MAG: Unknown protein [uncultured Thiotrichaceae bacterium]
MPKEAELREDGDKKEQMEWDRLQNEALAAQRYRLEQEIQQARAQGLIADDEPDDSFMGINWSGKWVLAAGAAALLVGSVVVVVLLA